MPSRLTGQFHAIRIDKTVKYVMGDKFSLQNIIDNDGISISITGMSIVFLALLLISLFIAALPHVLERLSGILPPEAPHAAPAARPDPAAQKPDEALVAAIGFALHVESQARKGEGQ